MVREEIPRSLTVFSSSALGIRFPSASSSSISASACAVLLSVLAVSVVRKQIGKTTYIVRVHFSETAKETMEDKIKRMLREEVRKM